MTKQQLEGAVMVIDSLRGEHVTDERLAQLAGVLRAQLAAAPPDPRDHRINQIETMNERFKLIMGRIMMAVKPELIEADGKTYEFAPPPDVVYKHWSFLSKAIREAIDSVRNEEPDPRDAALRDALNPMRRAAYLAEATQRFIDTNNLEEYTETWDDAECDGTCLVDDLGANIEETNAAIARIEEVLR